MKGLKPKTPYMLALRERILETAMTAFATKGIKAVKMDDIAQTLSISKRTLYEIYENKEILLFEGVKKYALLRTEQMKELYEKSSNVMDIIMGVYRMKVKEFELTCPEFYSDITKYPSVIEFLHKDGERSHDLFMGFLKRGVEERYFRPDVRLDMISMLFSAIMDYITKQQLYKTCTAEELFHNMLFVTMRGFCTTEGAKLLDNYIQGQEG
jgi:AcrR family transcriptional regulator